MLSTFKSNNLNNNTKKNIKRTFTVLDYPTTGKNFGKFKSTSFTTAANKAIKSLCKEFNMLDTIHNANDTFIKFWLKEITPKSKKRDICYIGIPVKLEKPVIINRAGKNISYEYKYIITKYTDQFIIE
jgi:hypothetical protein